MNIQKIPVALFMAAACSGTVSAQTGAGSLTLDNSYRASASTDSTFEYAETLCIGPNAVWEVDGVHIIYSKNIWIAPTAQITGNGILIIANPEDNPFYPDMTGSTAIDGNNGNFIEINIQHRNPNNIMLADLTDPGYGTANPAGALAAGLKLGKNLSFEVNNGDVLLNGNDMVFDNNATISNYGANRMIVTGNSITGHVVKENATPASFVFPVGITEGDYTPATITGAGNYHISVTDYTAAIPVIQAPEEGMHRTWHIYGGAASSVTLQHNSPLTDGASYTDANAFITRYSSVGTWTTGISEQTASGVHTNTAAIGSGIPVSASADAAWLTKTSDATTPLPVGIISFDAYRKGSSSLLEWATASEQANKGFAVERSADGVSWHQIGFVNSLSKDGNSNTALSYMYPDEKPFTGLNYYRLKQTDADNRFQYSPVRSVVFNESDQIKIYPNPVKTVLYINLPASITHQPLAFSIINPEGKLVYSRQIQNANQNETLDVSSLTNGMYFLKIQQPDGEAEVIRIQVIK